MTLIDEMRRLYPAKQTAEWEKARLSSQLLTLRQEIALAESKVERLQDSIEQRKKAYARLESQLALAGSDLSRFAMIAAPTG